MYKHAIASLIATLILATSLTAKETEPNPTAPEKEFAGKIVAVHMANNAMYKLENVTVIHVGSESFLSGTGIERKEIKRQEWWHGLPIRLNLRFVDSYFPMSPEQWKALNEEYPAGAVGTK